MTKIQSAIRQALASLPERTQQIAASLLKLEFVNERGVSITLQPKDDCVLTGDFNYAMPMILVDGPDLAVVYAVPCNGNPLMVTKVVPVGTLPELLEGFALRRSVLAGIELARRASYTLYAAA